MKNFFGEPFYDRAITCCFSGYRPNKLPWRFNEDDERCIHLKTKLFDVVYALYKSGIRHFICGMALGSDTYFCEAVLKLRDKFDDVTIEAAIPCEEQAKRWTEPQRDRYFYLVQQCDSEHIVNYQYTSTCMVDRNRYMVDNSSVIVTVYDGQFGGTMQTVSYAQSRGLEIIQIAP